MGTDRLLADLDDDFWRQLGYAEVPVLLRAMTSAGPEQADGLVGALAEDIVNLDTAYPATAPAIPYIARLAAGGVLTRDLVILLGFIAQSTAECHGPDEQSAWEAVRRELPLLLGLTGSDDARVRYAAVWAAAQYGTADLVVPVLRDRWTTERDPSVRAALLLACAELDPAWAGQAAARVLDDEDAGPLHVLAVLVCLKNGESWSPDFTEALVRSHAQYLALDDPLWGTDPLPAAVEHLSEHGRWTDACDLVEAALRHAAPEAGSTRSSAVRQAADLCMAYRSAPARLLPALARLSADPEVGPRVADLIGRLGPTGAGAADVLAAAAGGDVTAEVADHALAALIALGDRRAASLLAAQLSNRPTALEELGRHGVAFDPELLAAIRERLRNPSAGSMEWVTLIGLLERWGPPASAALPELLGALSHDHLSAPDALAAVAESDADRDLAVEALRSAVTEGQAEGRLTVAHALWKLAGDARPLLAETADALSASGPVGHAAARAAIELGTDAQPILPALTGALEAAAPDANNPDLGRALRLATALWQLTGDTDRVLPVIAAGLAEWSTADRAAAVAALLGPAAMPLADQLLAMLHQPYRTASVARALLRIHPEDPAQHGLSTIRLVHLLLTAAERDANALDALAVLAELGPQCLDDAAVRRVSALAERTRRITRRTAWRADIDHDEELRAAARSLLVGRPSGPSNRQGQSMPFHKCDSPVRQ